MSLLGKSVAASAEMDQQEYGWICAYLRTRELPDELVKTRRCGSYTFRTRKGTLISAGKSCNG